MANESRLRVSNPPPRPLMIWDGECHFCKRWIERWREITAGKVDYATYQETAARFPEIPVEQFKRAVAFVEPDGEAYFAAEAVYRSLRYRSSRKWLAWSYDHVPGFAAISETAYKFIAHNRSLGSTVTRLLWGKDVRPPTYFWARRWFLRMFGLIYLIAFVSLWVQVDGLVGSNGMSPVSQFLPAVRQQVGLDAYFLLPTLCWFDSSNAFLHFLCGGGVVLSWLLIFGVAPALSLVGLLVFYLSLTIAGQVFLNFQWDVLLLEVGFLSIFLAPWRLWPRDILLWPASAIPTTAISAIVSPVSRAGLFLLKFLLFKLMLMSGVVKLTSGDDSWGWVNHSFHWSALTALDYHYWSQPLPTIFSWWADKTPEWFKHFSVAFCLAVEIIASFFIWAPRRPRLVAAGLMIFLQMVIALTGNYCFFNLLTIALCLLLIDDAAISRGMERRAPASPASQELRPPNAKSVSARWATYGAIAVIVVTFPINAWLIFSAFKPQSRPPGWLANIYEQLEAFRIVNGYGLFRVMTKDRCEIVIEGSTDGINWAPYEFKWKPGDVKRAPGWCAPHQPRLDWQMWFAALETPGQNPWLVGLIIRLLEGSQDVTGLLAHNPFPDKPPNYIRAMFYRYRFTNSEERPQTGAWWKRQELREYLPTISRDQLR
ncbi:MAG TPA: lipase maturation factor family protein [Candidatus Udaeobacter sp.]|nr:lipase maturation factor family protein [Candidatus Udaeobacter sp.]